MSESDVNESLGLIAWTRNPGRFTDLGRVFSVEPKIIGFARLRSRWSAPIRYTLSVVSTIAWLLATRPRVVIVCCPPPFASALVAAYARAFRAVYLLDAHPGAFGHRDKLWRLFLPLQRMLVSRALVTMVTEPTLGHAVERWGGRSLVFHEVPPAVLPTPPRADVGARPRVVFTTIFDPDEPLDVITGAACDLTECDVTITGDPSRLAPGLRDRLLAESHIQLTGWLDQRSYLALIASSDIVVSLTRDHHSVMRSAFEAVYLERPTVLSDTATLRECFSPSVFVGGRREDVGGGVREIIKNYNSWRARTGARHRALVCRWEHQQRALEAVIGEALRTSASDGRVLVDA
jgi:glycosyltransferase involved in cell wall biosynthesis